MRLSHICVFWGLNQFPPQVPVVVHNEDERAIAWSKIFSDNTEDEVIPVMTAWQLNERM